MKKVRIALIFGVLSLLAGQSVADTLLIDRVEKSPHIARPERGQTSAQVVKQFGQPVKKHSPIGQPPITKWSYESITVYFEYDHVIHAVVNRKK